MGAADAPHWVRDRPTDDADLRAALASYDRAGPGYIEHAAEALADTLRDYLDTRRSATGVEQ